MTHQFGLIAMILYVTRVMDFVLPIHSLKVSQPVCPPHSNHREKSPGYRVQLRLQGAIPRCNPKAQWSQCNSCLPGRGFETYPIDDEMWKRAEFFGDTSRLNQFLEKTL